MIVRRNRHRNLAQFVGVPAARLDFMFEEALNFFGMRRRTAVLDYDADMFGDIGGSLFHDNQPIAACVVSPAGFGSTNLS